MDIDKSELKSYFLDFSVVITNFSKFNLQGTGQAESYYSTVEKIIGEEMFGELLETFHNIDVKAKTANNQTILTTELRSQILGSEKFGAITRNIIKLWYIATWYQLPQSWRETFGARENDKTFVVSPQAYPEGLLWSAIGVNPPAAKAPGYGTWSYPPTVTLD